MLLIGCHVSFGEEQLLGSANEALSYGSNTFMIYTGAPINTLRTEIDNLLLEKAYQLMKDKIMIDKIICHAPYIINLANRNDEIKYYFSLNFLKQEIKRCAQMHIKYLVLHPGNAVGITKEEGLNNIATALNTIIDSQSSVTILLETMAGKGTECGQNIEELKYIIDNINHQLNIGVCLDTCHLHDAGYDLNNFAKYLDDFEQKIGINKIKCIHINDSKNPLGSHKDRHANIGFGNIGFENLLNIIYNERLRDIPKILETPNVGENSSYPPYKFEIEMIKNKTFDPKLLNKIQQFYQK